MTKNEPLSDEYKLDVYSDGHDERKLDLGFTFLEEIEKLGNWDKSGHSDIFRFKLAYFDLEKDKLTEFKADCENPLFLVSAMEYNNTIVSVVVAAKPEIQKLMQPITRDKYKIELNKIKQEYITKIATTNSDK